MTTAINANSEMIYLFDSPDIMSAFAPLPPSLFSTASHSNKKQKEGSREIARSNFNQPFKTCYSKGGTHPDQEPAEDDAKVNNFCPDAVVSFRSNSKQLPKGRFETRADFSPFYPESVRYSTEEQNQNSEATYSTSALCYPESGYNCAESCNESVHNTTSLRPRSSQMVVMMSGQTFPPSLPQYDQSEACQKRDLIAPFDSCQLFLGDMFANEELVKEDKEYDSIKDLDQMASIGEGEPRYLTASDLDDIHKNNGKFHNTAPSPCGAPQKLICHLLPPSDRQFTTAFTLAVFDQLEIICFGEKDKRSNRAHLTLGYSGLGCRHCRLEAGRAGRFFPSTLKTLSDQDKALFAIYRHLQKCKETPNELMVNMSHHRNNHTKEKILLKTRPGRQRIFFRRVWGLLRAVDENTASSWYESV